MMVDNNTESFSFLPPSPSTSANCTNAIENCLRGGEGKNHFPMQNYILISLKSLLNSELITVFCVFLIRINSLGIFNGGFREEGKLRQKGKQNKGVVEKRISSDGRMEKR